MGSVLAKILETTAAAAFGNLEDRLYAFVPRCFRTNLEALLTALRRRLLYLDDRPSPSFLQNISMRVTERFKVVGLGQYLRQNA